MTTAHLPAVAALEVLCHAPLPPEGEALFVERLALFPRGCLVVTDQEGLAGYAVAHPARRGEPPHLGETLGALPAGADCLHLHDLALHPRVRGQRLPGGAVALLVALARAEGLARLSLVAVHGTAPLWARQGFAPAEAALHGYGGGAVYMLREA
ncbi:GNAT family N-acetyltransferase [Elioraea sp.]|uniref:GNAT family N-acetyltransferase n=1 Tax=Elioraea sp. TaxID=2185103 RepID=UPI0025BF6C86|nr:GNAT family N-acetyltransferase [Elioraea sp.]